MAGSGHQRARRSGATTERRAGAGNRVTLPDRYEPLGLIARGGMASVWAARDRKLDREVAVKLLGEPFAREELSVRRFQREALAAARLSGHPNVVGIYDVGRQPGSEGSSPGRPFIVMELLSGGTVAEAARLGEVDRAQAIEWLHAAAAALDHAHRRGVIHRDVKPSNFLLDDHRVLHVGDFGIASLGTEDTLSATGYLLGTAAYLSPERALGQPSTPASDRYSLAVAAFELLAGERPFAAPEPAAVARQQVEATPRGKLPQSHPPAGARRGPGARAGQGARAPVADRRGTRRRDRGGARRRSPLASRAGPVHEPRAHRPGSRRGARGRRVIVAIVAIVAIAGGIGGSRSGRASSGHRAIALRTAPVRQVTRRPAHRPAPPATTASSSQAPTGPPSADSLETRGHGLMEAGDYAAAVPVLRERSPRRRRRASRTRTPCTTSDAR